MDNKMKKGIMLGLLLLGCGLTSLLGGILGSSNNGAAILKLDEKRNEDKSSYGSSKARQGNMMKIYVSGAVSRPGLYDLPLGARADDAVVVAGGMTMEADPTRVNLALKLKDGMQVNVPFKKQKYQKQYTNSYNKNSKGNGYEKQINMPTANKAVGKINLNTATAKELEQLPGIGPSMAQKIINYRNTYSFSSVEDLAKIPGIGKAKLDRLRDRISI